MNRLLTLCLGILAVSSWTTRLDASPAENLARALTFKTISRQDKSTIDYEQFDKLHLFLRETYPLVFSELEVEVVNRYSLLLNWPGTDPDAAPTLASPIASYLAICG